MNSSKKLRARNKLSAAGFDAAFERGDVVDHLDLHSAVVEAPTQRVNIDIPRGILESIDREAERIGVPRTSLIKLWLAERLGQMKPA